MKMSKRSSNLPIWNFFNKSIDGSKIATCNYCCRDLSYKTSVTNLKQHLKQKHISVYHMLINFGKPPESSSVPDTDKEGEEDIEETKTGPADIGDTNTFNETDASSSEEKCSSRTFFKDSQGSLSWVTSSKKRQYNPSELQEPKKRKHKETKIILKPVSHQMDKDEEDECDIFGKLIAKKMRKLSEDRKDAMMIKINKLFYEECHERNRLSPSLSF